MEQKIIQRDWGMYNAAQTSEKERVMQLVNEAVDYIGIPYEYKGDGRPHNSLDDMIKCCIIKVFNNFSTRRTMFDIRLAHALGYISVVPHFNSISNYMRKEEITPHLHRIYRTLALPLRDIDYRFAIDSTGFTNFRKKSWVDYRLNKHETRKDWKKLHIVTGVLSNIITAAKVTGAYASDTRQFEHLVKQSSEKFRMFEIDADSAYLSKENCIVAQEVGSIPFIMPKSNTNLIKKFKDRTAWNRMINMWRDHKDDFLQHYHQRSNVESTFSSIKRKFLPYVRSKDEISQENEILLKVICHNASVLCNSMFELGASPYFKE